MKRNKYRKLICLGFLLLHAGIFPISALSAELEIDTNEVVEVSLQLYDADSERLIESIKNGYKSKVTIQIHLFKKRAKPFSIIGDILLENIEVYKSAEKDFFSDSIMVKYNNNILYFDDEESFLNQYFQSLTAIPENLININDYENYYIKVKATLVNRIYVQPFNIYYLLNLRDRSTTGWIKGHFVQEVK